MKQTQKADTGQDGSCWPEKGKLLISDICWGCLWTSNRRLGRRVLSDIRYSRLRAFQPAPRSSLRALSQGWAQSQQLINTLWRCLEIWGAGEQEGWGHGRGVSCNKDLDKKMQIFTTQFSLALWGSASDLLVRSLFGLPCGGNGLS